MTNPAARVGARPPVLPTLSDRQRLMLAGLAALGGIAALAVSLHMPPHTHGPALGLGVVVAFPMVIWRRWLFALLALATALVTVDLGSGRLSLGLTFILGFAAYTVALRVPRRSSIRAALITAAVLGAALTSVWFTDANAPVAFYAVETFLPLGAGWFVGDSVAARRRYMAGLVEQAERELTAEAERARREISAERVRIAHELHDVIAHGLAVITVQAGVGRRLMAKHPEEAASALASIETIGRTAQEELRVVLGLLRDEEVTPAALTPAPGLPDLTELVDHVRAAGTPVDLHVSGVDGQLSPALELSVYRVIQEALTNAVKHAPGARVTVDLAVRAQEVRIAVTDDGAAAGAVLPAPGPPASGHGLVGMRERVGAFGGSLVARPAGGQGFRVLARIPLQDSA